MLCKTEDLGKIYNHHVIFERFNFTFQEGKNYVIQGGNGSGKSTLLRILSGGSEASEGSIRYSLKGEEVPAENLIQHLSFSAPYLGLIEEFTFEELIDYQRKFKPFIDHLSTKNIIGLSQLENIQNKPIKHFSSGMKQRVRLLLAILADCSLLLLDEPVSNLDHRGKKWYADMLVKYGGHKTIVVCSNHLEEEYPENPEFIDIHQYKP